MSSTAALSERDQRILAGHAAGATIPQLCLAEEVAPKVVRRVLRTVGFAQDGRRTLSPPCAGERTGPPDRLAGPAWLAPESAEKTCAQIAEELSCMAWAVYGALQAAGIARRVPREYVSKARGVEPWSAETADEVIERYATGESAPAIAEPMEVGQWRVSGLPR